MAECARTKMLLVDDATMFRLFLKDALCARFPGVEVLEAGSVAEGYRCVKEHQPRLVLLDVSLPDGNGLALARRIRDELPEVVVCICTLHDEPEYRQAAAESGAACFICKQGDVWNEAEHLVSAAFEGANGDRGRGWDTALRH
jgi:DNA-binding NarL/FixJ family response regulator